MLLPRRVLQVSGLLLLCCATARVAQSKPRVPLATATFGTVKLKFVGPEDTQKWLSDAVPERQTVKGLKKLRGRHGLRFQEGALGSYSVSVRGEGDSFRGKIAVTVSIRAVGPQGLVEVDGSGSDFYPQPREKSFSLDTPAPYPQLYPPVRSTYVPPDKDDKETARQKEERQQKQKEQDEVKAGEAFENALDEARHQAESHLFLLLNPPAPRAR